MAGCLVSGAACAASQVSEPQRTSLQTSAWPDDVVIAPLIPDSSAVDEFARIRDVCGIHTSDTPAGAALGTTWTEEYAAMLSGLDQARQELQVLRHTERSEGPTGSVDGYTSFLQRWIRNADPMLVLTDRGFRIADHRVCRLAALAEGEEQLRMSLAMVTAARADSGSAACLDACAQWMSGELNASPALDSADVDSEWLLAE
jgi:hypothetical protein